MTRARILADYVSSGDELALKAPLASPAFTGTPTGVHLARNGDLSIAWASNTTIDIDADILTLYNSSNVGVIVGTSGVASSINLTLNEANDTSGSGSNGVLGLDTGSFANSTWYHLYVIYNGSAVSCVASLAQNWISTTNDGSAGTTKGVDKTNISGYTYGKYVGAVYRNGSGNFDSFWQKGNDVQIPNVTASETTLTTTWATRDLSAFVPSTAQKANGELRSVVSTYFTLNIMIASYGTGSTYQNGHDQTIVYFYGSSTNHGSLQIAGPYSVRLHFPQTVYVRPAYSTIGSSMVTVAGWSYSNIV